MRYYYAYYVHGGGGVGAFRLPLLRLILQPYHYYVSTDLVILYHLYAVTSKKEKIPDEDNVHRKMT